eukprot:1307700-Amorphochlora_amoeboformis.AAC.2
MSKSKPPHTTLLFLTPPPPSQHHPPSLSNPLSSHPHLQVRALIILSLKHFASCKTAFFWMPSYGEGSTNTIEKEKGN